MTMQQLMLASVKPLAASASPSVVNQSAANGVTITAGPSIIAEGGVGPYTYSTSVTSGGTGVSLSQQATAAPRLSGTGTNVLRTGACSTTVTDAIGNTTSVAWGYGFTWGTPA